MKFKLFSLLTIVALLMGVLAFPHSVQAIAYGSAFATSITYMNVGIADADITFYVYAEGSATPISWSPPVKLPVHGASSVFVGTLIGGSATFQGSALISSSEVLAVTGVQSPAAGSPVKVRLLSNGFSQGAPSVTIPSVLKSTFNETSSFAVQNADSDPADVTVTFYPLVGTPPVLGTPFSVTIPNLPAGGGKLYDMGTFVNANIGTTFNGSVKISSKKSLPLTGDGLVVASAQGFRINSNEAYAFEGVSNGGNVAYMPSAFCNWGSGDTIGIVNSAYAVMNMGTGNVDITVKYANNAVPDTYLGLTPGMKQSFPGCTKNVPGYRGSATITAVTSSGAVGTPSISAIGKVYGSGYSTAFSGFTQGYTSLALPYVRYTNLGWADGSRQRVYLAVQNVDQVNTVAIGAISIQFYNYAGAPVGSPMTNPTALAPNEKWSLSAQTINLEFGYWTVGSGVVFGGGAIVTGPAGSLAVIGRAQTYDNTNGWTWTEDYNGIPLQ